MEDLDTLETQVLETLQLMEDEDREAVLRFTQYTRDKRLRSTPVSLAHPSPELGDYLKISPEEEDPDIPEDIEP